MQLVGVQPQLRALAGADLARRVHPGHRGYEFEANVELTESMGSEIYAHFDFDQGDSTIESEELRELQEDAGTSDVPGSASGHAVARVDAASGVKAGERARLWLDTDKLHLFNASDGLSLTRAEDAAAAAA